MKDSAATHIIWNSVSALQELFNGGVFSTRLWPPRPWDLSVYDFYLGGSLKGKVYRNTPHTARDLKNEIRKVVALLSADKLQCVLQGFLRRCEVCLRATGSHFEHFCNIWWVFLSFYLLISCASWTDGFKPQNEDCYSSSGSEHKG